MSELAQLIDADLEETIDFARSDARHAVEHLTLGCRIEAFAWAMADVMSEESEDMSGTDREPFHEESHDRLHNTIDYLLGRKRDFEAQYSSQSGSLMKDAHDAGTSRRHLSGD